MTDILLTAPRALLIISTLVFAVGGVSLTFATLISINVIHHSRWAWVFQVLLTLQMFVWSWQSITVLTLRQQGFLPDTLERFNYLLIPVLLLGLYLAWRTRHRHYLITTLLWSLSLPFFTGLLPDLLLIGVKWVIAVESIDWVLWVLSQRSRSLGPVALKDAFDNLPAGLAFYDEKGRVLMMNWRLRSYLSELNISDLNSWKQVSQNLREHRLADDSNPLGDTQVDVVLPSGRVVLFTMENLPGGTTTIRQLYATDITERYRLDAELKQQTKSLEENLLRVKELIHIRQQAAEQNTFLAARTRLHDVLAQRMSLVHRFVEDRVDSPERISELVNLLSRLREDLLDTPRESALREEYRSLMDSFRLVGLSIHTTGKLPKSVNYRQTFVDMLRECATNALMHSDSHRLYVDITNTPGGIVWEFANSVAPGKTVGRGNGLEGMRRRVETLGGSFTYEVGDNFVVRAELPPEP